MKLRTAQAFIFWTSNQLCWDLLARMNDYLISKGWTDFTYCLILDWAGPLCSSRYNAKHV